MTDPIKPPRLAAAVAGHLQEMILEGVLRPGDRLAAERDLAERLEVSRPSLREALAILERKGLLVTTKAGTTVARFLAPLSEPLAELFAADGRVAADYFEYRQGVEAQAARLAALRATEADRAAIKAQLDALEAAHLADDPGAEAAADVDLHQLVYEAAHNVVLLHMMRAMADLLRRGIFYSRDRLYRRPGVAEAVLAQHRAIAEAVLARDPAAAEKAAVDHLAYIFATVEEIRRDDLREAAALRRVDRRSLVAE
ncbi:FCD domain-containing protein [Zavarzinia sp.]|uniref:FCD domain-containing protein n=1 Tax=Zavarzinia sp. TaxID=2027920 RepID=UPI00356B2357